MIWYSSHLDDVAQELKTDLEKGLSESEAAIRLQEYGTNKLNEKKPRSFFHRFLDQMKDAMVIILILAAIVSLGLSIYNFIQGTEGRWIEPIVIVLIVIVNGLLGVIQERKQRLPSRRSKNMSSPSARVLRDGELRTISSTALVPGDVLDMEAGDLVPADCRLISSSSFKCDESALTGESIPVEKDASADIADIAPLGDRLNMAYSGCSRFLWTCPRPRGRNWYAYRNGQDCLHAGK